MLYMRFQDLVQNGEATVVVAGLGTAVAALASRCKKLPWRPVRGTMVTVALVPFQLYFSQQPFSFELLEKN